MSDTVKRLLERRAQRVNEMRTVAERAVDENRNMSGEEERQFDELNAEVDALQKRADAILEGEKRAKEIEDSFAALAGKPVDHRVVGAGVDRDKELRSFLLGEPGAPRSLTIHPPTPAERRAQRAEEQRVGLVKGT